MIELEKSELKFKDIVFTKLYQRLREADTKFQRREIMLDFYELDISNYKNKRKKEVLNEIDQKIKNAGPHYIYFPTNIHNYNSKFLRKHQNIK